MESIYIPRLTRLLNRTERIEFSEVIAGLETLTPVQGWVQVVHQGNYLEVSAKAEAIVTLSCHRCLQQYNYRLSIAPTELIWLSETPDNTDLALFERDISSEDLIETLSPQGYFELETWLYEQLCLELPQRQLCDQNCQGIEVQESTPAQPVIDRRWASLESLKNQLSDRN